MSNIQVIHNQRQGCLFAVSEFHRPGLCFRISERAMEFPTTHWTMLAQATLHGDTSAGKALEEFVLSYRAPVLALLRRRGVPDVHVEDLTQEFFLQLMKNSSLKRADR